MTLRIPFLSLFLLAHACGSSIEPDADDGPENPATDGAPGDGADAMDEAQEVEIDASSTDTWTYFDLETGKVVRPASPESSNAWDLAFKRFSIAMNGGVSGQGGVEVAVLPLAFEALDEAPVTSFVRDVADGADEDEEPDLVMSTGDTGWYDYDPSDHTLTPRDHVYAIRTVERSIFKLAVVGYYNAAGSSGYPRIRFERLAEGPVSGPDAGSSQPDAGTGASDASTNAPDAHTNAPDAGASEDASTGERNYGTLTIDASSATAWVYVSVAEGVVSVADDASSLAWDLAFQRTLLRTNGGTSGPGMAGARLLEGDFGSLEVAPHDDGFVVDAQLPVPGPPGSGTFSGNEVLSAWYDYDTATHAVTPKNQAYLIRTAAGSLGKFRITSWANGLYTVDVGALRAP